jgi:hypothetical protein
MTRVKIEGTVSKSVLQELRHICELEAEKADLEDKVQPTVSHVLEMLLRKGIKAYKRERK